jgi:hypothetical protein
VVTSQGASAVRLYAGGDAAEWDVGISPLRELAYRLAGHDVPVEIAIPGAIFNQLEESDRFSLASLADHPKITVCEIEAVPRCGSGWLLAEALPQPSNQWALGLASATAFNEQWGKNADCPLVTSTKGGVPTPKAVNRTAESIRPRPLDAGDREIEVHHELDGPLQGFGKRLWGHVAQLHTPTQKRFADLKDEVRSVTYRDRYLFTPLSVALLVELIAGLREFVGRERWAAPAVRIVTTNRRASGENLTRNRIWSDWIDASLRDRALRATFDYIGITACVEIADTATTGHSRLLEVEWSSRMRSTLRFDQGISYWRAARSNKPQETYFNTGDSDSDEAGRHLAELSVNVEGSQLPTQLFAKIRQEERQ